MQCMESMNLGAHKLASHHRNLGEVEIFSNKLLFCFSRSLTDNSVPLTHQCLRPIKLAPSEIIYN